MDAVRATYDAVPWLTEQFQSEYSQVLLGLHCWDNYHLGTTDPWDTVDDLKGVKIGGAGPNLPWLEFTGAVPIQSTLPMGDLSLQTGVYHGWLMFASAYLGFKFYEPAPNYTLIGFGAMGVNALTMNKRKFDSLPLDPQKIMLDVGRAYEDQAGASLNGRQKAGLDDGQPGRRLVFRADEGLRVNRATSKKFKSVSPVDALAIAPCDVTY